MTSPVVTTVRETPVQVLVINSGSSSVKFELFAMDPEVALMRGEVSRIGQVESEVSVRQPADAPAVCRPASAPDYAAAMALVLDLLHDAEAPVDVTQVAAVGHRIVHGGERYTHAVRITDDVIDGIREAQILAPVHISANLAGIRGALEVFSDVCHVAVFDTAFHRTIPKIASTYALPKNIAEPNHIRRYGFHGMSHRYVGERAAAVLGQPLEELNLITMHLGNGASVCAQRGGISVDTSMGMTPLEGLVMGTRCGDIDPAVPGLIGVLVDAPREDVNRILNFESGLKGMCGVSDVRQVHELVAQGDDDAALALGVFCYRAKKYVGAYVAALGQVDALVFTAGVGENDPEVRRRICCGLDRLGIELDGERNEAEPDCANPERVISTDESQIAVLVIPTDEEREIARAAYECALDTRE